MGQTSPHHGARLGAAQLFNVVHEQQPRLVQQGHGDTQQELLGLGQVPDDGRGRGDGFLAKDVGAEPGDLGIVGCAHYGPPWRNPGEAFAQGGGHGDRFLQFVDAGKSGNGAELLHGTEAAGKFVPAHGEGSGVVRLLEKVVLHNRSYRERRREGHLCSRPQRFVQADDHVAAAVIGQLHGFNDGGLRIGAD